MGNETSILKKCNVSSKARHTTTEWSLFDATHENQSFSAFIFNDNQYCNDITKWKHVRHPYLVKFYEAGLYKNKKYILTEPVIPIKELLDKLHRFSKLSGLCNIGDSLSFLHEKCNISVNNLSIDTIFVTKNDPNELWKIGSLYWCSSIESEDSEFVKSLISFHTLNGTLKTLPPENRDIKNPILIRSLKEIHRRDVYSFINLIEELFYKAEITSKISEISSEDGVTNHNLMAKTLIENFNKCHADQRPTVIAILQNQLFQNCPFIQLKQFLSHFSTYNDQEKYSFLEVLIENLRQFSDQTLVVNIFTMIVSSRLIMSNRLIFNHVMPYFLIPCTNNQSTRDSLPENVQQSTIENRKSEDRTYKLTNGETITLNPFIDAKTFRENVIPHIINLYCVHDYKIRMLLLQYLPHYGSFISKSCLKKILLPQILLGIKDSDTKLVSLTFRAVAVLIDLFGVITVLGGSNRTRYFTASVSGDNEICDRNHRDHHEFDSPNSIKSSLYSDKMSSILFNERSSPDGDETRESNLSLNENSNIKFSSVETSENEWPVWEENKDDSQLKTDSTTKTVSKTDRASKIAEMVNKKSSFKEKLQTFDIKELDFKEVNYTKEIDNLFIDMAPVLKFNQNKITSIDKIRPDDNKLSSNEPLKIDPSIFEAKNELDMLEIENSGWNDSFDWNDVNGTVLDGTTTSLDGNDHNNQPPETMNSVE